MSEVKIARFVGLTFGFYRFSINDVKILVWQRGY